MAREFFCAYHSYAKSIRNLSDAECGRLFKALLSYSAGDTLINLQGREGIAFDFITEQIDRDNEAYEAKCAKNRANGSQANGTERPRTVPNAPQGEGEGKEEGKEKEDLNISSPPVSPSKPKKHKYGEYSNVLLTDEELEKLKDEFSDWEQRIERLSAYKASTGKVYKNDLATIRNWAKRDGDKKAEPTRKTSKAEELDDFYAMAREWSNG